MRYTLSERRERKEGGRREKEGRREIWERRWRRKRRGRVEKEKVDSLLCLY